MTIFSARGRRILLWSVLSIGWLYDDALATTASNNELVRALSRTLKLKSSAAVGPAEHYLEAFTGRIEAWYVQGRYVELERELTRILLLLPAGNEPAADLIQRIITNLRMAAVETNAKLEAAYRPIERDFTSKYEAKAPAADFDSLLRRLALPLLADTDNAVVSRNVATLRSLISSWQDYTVQSSHGRPVQALQALQELIRDSDALPVLPRSQLLELRLTAEAASRSPTNSNEEIAQKYRAQLRALLVRAERAADLDDFIFELSDTLAASPDHPSLNVIWRCAEHWQQLLHAREVGNRSHARTFWDMISKDTESEDIFPVAMARAKLFGDSAGNSILAVPLIAPEDLTAWNSDVLWLQLLFRREHSVPVDFNSDALVELLYFVRTARGLTYSGNDEFAVAQLAEFDQMLAAAPPPGPYRAALKKIGSELKKHALEDFYSPPHGLAPTDQDTLETFVDKLTAYGFQQKDWALVYRVYKADKILHRGNLDSAANLKAFGSLMDAMQYERAGLTIMAGDAYLKALSEQATKTPAEDIGVRLRHINQQPTAVGLIQ